MATIAIVGIDEPSGTPQAASASGDQYQNSGEHILLVFNNGASDADVTRLAQTQPESPDSCDDEVYTCPAGEMSMLPQLTPRRFNDRLGYVQVRYEVGTAPDLTVIVIHAPRAR